MEEKLEWERPALAFLGSVADLVQGGGKSVEGFDGETPGKTGIG